MATKERLGAGEIVWITNYPTAQDIDDDYFMFDTSYVRQQSANMRLLTEVRDEYGVENVVTGNAYDAKTGTASGIPKMVGVYVTAEAYLADHHATRKALQ